MRYKIINRAGSRDIFSGGVRYYLARNEILPTNDPQLAGDAGKLPFISVIKDLSDYEVMNFFKLKKIAKEKGIEFNKKSTKKEIINKLSEVK